MVGMYFSSIGDKGGILTCSIPFSYE